MYINESTVDKLLKLCRRDLQITWQDYETDEQIKMYIRNAAYYLFDKCGVIGDDDLLAGGRGNALLLAYVRRARSGDISTFEKDYLQDIISLQIDIEY